MKLAKAVFGIIMQLHVCNEYIWSVLLSCLHILLKFRINATYATAQFTLAHAGFNLLYSCILSPSTPNWSKIASMITSDGSLELLMWKAAITSTVQIH